MPYSAPERTSHSVLMQTLEAASPVREAVVAAFADEAFVMSMCEKMSQDHRWMNIHVCLQASNIKCIPRSA